MVLTTEWAQVEVIDLTNDGNGLGFNIVGGKSTGVVVKCVVPGGAADKDGRLQGGDHVLQVGAVNLRGFGSEQVASVLRQSGDAVKLLVARPVDPASVDFGDRRAPIVPTRLLSDPEQLDLHLVDAGLVDAYDAVAPTYDPPPPAEEPAAPLVDVVAPPSPSPEMEVVTVALNKNVYGLGVTVAGYVCEKEELSGIFVKSIIEGSAAELSGKIKINDRIVDVDGESLVGKTNHQAVEILRNTSVAVTLVLERHLRGPKYEHLRSALWSEDSPPPPPSPPSPSVATLSWFRVRTDNAESVGDAEETERASRTTVESATLDPDELELDDEPSPEEIEKELDAELDAAAKDEWAAEDVGDDKELIVAEISKLSGLGISLEGTVDVEGGRELRPRHFIRSILPQGPVGLHGALRSGDELLRVNEHCLRGLKHTEVVAILKELPARVRLVCARSCGDAGPCRLINVSQDREGFETRKIISGSLHSLGGAAAAPPVVKSRSDGSIGTSSTATPTASKKSRSLECVSNLAMWSDEEAFVELQKGEQGLGFSILDYQDPVDPAGTVIVVRSLVPGGVAEKQGEITPGDRLLSVNGADIRNVTLDQAVYALKSAPLGPVVVGVARPLSTTENCKSRSIENSVGGSLDVKISS